MLSAPHFDFSCALCYFQFGYWHGLNTRIRSPNFAAGCHASARRTDGGSLVRVVPFRGCRIRCDRGLLGHFLAHVHRPRHVLDTGAHAYPIVRNYGRIDQWIPDSLLHFRARSGTGFGQRERVEISRAAGLVYRGLGRRDHAYVSAV
jgi:hypothetical protein